MNRLPFAILGLLLLSPGTLLAQPGYNPSYTPNPNLYGPNNRALLPPSLSLLTNGRAGGPGFGNGIYPGIYLPNSQGQAAYQQTARALAGLGQASPLAPGAMEEDPFAIQPAAGHAAVYMNTGGYYPPNPRQRLTGNQTTGSGSGTQGRTPTTPSTPR